MYSFLWNLGWTCMYMVNITFEGQWVYYTYFFLPAFSTCPLGPIYKTSKSILKSKSTSLLFKLLGFSLFWNGYGTYEWCQFLVAKQLKTSFQFEVLKPSKHYYLELDRRWLWFKTDFKVLIKLTPEIQFVKFCLSLYLHSWHQIRINWEIASLLSAPYSKITLKVFPISSHLRFSEGGQVNLSKTSSYECGISLFAKRGPSTKQ